MNNIYIYMLSVCIVLKVFVLSLTSFKIDATINLINEDLISKTIDESSKIEAINENSIYYLALNEQYLKDTVDDILKRNISFTTYKVNYYFYNCLSSNNTPIKNMNNSVQMQILITYENNTYESVKRYEPIEV